MDSHPLRLDRADKKSPPMGRGFRGGSGTLTENRGMDSLSVNPYRKSRHNNRDHTHKLDKDIE